MMLHLMPAAAAVAAAVTAACMLACMGPREVLALLGTDHHASHTMGTSSRMQNIHTLGKYIR